jgi:hypothetical protein
MSSIMERMSELNPKALAAEGFEKCIIGVAHRFGMEPVIAYDYHKCIKVLMKRDGMSYADAIEYFEFNTLGAWMGEGTPIFVER